MGRMFSTGLALQRCRRNPCTASEFLLPLMCKKYFPWNKMEIILFILKKSTSAAQWETIEGRWKHWKWFIKESRTLSFQIATFDFVLVIFQILSLFLLLRHLQSNQRTQYNYNNSAQESFQRLYWILSAYRFCSKGQKAWKDKIWSRNEDFWPCCQRAADYFNNSVKATILCVVHAPLSLKRIPIKGQGLFPLWEISKAEAQLDFKITVLPFIFEEAVSFYKLQPYQLHRKLHTI